MTRRFGTLLVCAVCFSLLLDVLLCGYVVPHLNGDAMFFTPQLMSFAQGSGLKNQYYDVPLAYSAAADGRHVWHGFLYQVITGRLLPTPTYASWFLVNRVYDGFALVALAAFLYRCFQHSATWRHLTFCFLGLVAIVGYALGVQGRPETLSLALCGAALLACMIPGAAARSLVMGGLAGLGVATSPLHGTVCSVVLAVYLAKQARNPGVWARALAVAGIGGVIGLGIALAGYPYGLGELLEGLRRHSHGVVAKPLSNIWYVDSWRTFFIFTGHFFLGPMIVLGTISAWQLARCSGGGAAGPWLAWACLGVGGLVFHYTNASGWYLAGGMIPLAVALAARALRLGVGQWAVAAALGIVGVAAVDPMLHLVAYGTGFRGMLLREASQSLRTDLGSSPRNTAFSATGFVLCDEQADNDALIWEQYMSRHVESGQRWFVLVQDWNATHPPAFDNYTLRHDRFLVVANQWLPMRLRQWFHPAGFQYALYEMNAEAAKSGAESRRD